MILDKVCNDIYRKFASRYMVTGLIHVSDVVTCPIKVFLNRVFSSSDACHSLARMSLGKAWERIVFSAIGRDFEFNREFYGKAKYSFVYRINGREIREEDSIDLVATPDFYKAGHVVEAKYTSWDVDDVVSISASHYDTMRNLRLEIPELSGLSSEHAWLPVFYGWLIQLSAYIQATNADKASLIVIYRNYIDELEFKGEYLGRIREFYSLWRDLLPLTIVAIEFVKTWPLVTSKADPVQILKQMVFTLWSKAIHTRHLLKYFQCDDCPYWKMRTCPSLPPIKVVYEDEQRRIVHMLTWLKELDYEAKVSEGYRKAVDVTINAIQKVVSRNWLSALRRPLGAIPARLTPEGRVERPTEIERALAKMAQLEEAKDIEVWGYIHGVKVPTKWLMKEMGDLGKIPLTPKQVATAKAHGDVIRTEGGIPILIPSPTPEDYRIAKQTLYIWLRRLQEAIPDPELNIRILEVSWGGEAREETEARG